ncbi:MAG: OmpA family protein [Bacteroidetes bacterium]|nr:OmpA family protein [Bacteroidota bacterium]
MKKILIFIVVLGLASTTFAQTSDNKKMPSLGINFFLQDFKTPASIASNGFSSVMQKNKWGNISDMSSGLSLQYLNGLTDHIDFATTLGASFLNYPVRPSSGISQTGGSKFLLEADAGINVKLLTDKYFIDPYINMGVGASMYAGTYFAAYAPVGGGLQFNLGDGSYVNLQFNYRVEVSGLSTKHFNYGFGFVAPLKDKKPPVVAPPPPPPPPAPVDTDTDGDGINDDNDKCPTVKGVAKYAGCPVPDTDKDGINDDEDKCPTVAGLARYQGCPIPDTDKDGLNDEVDKCPTVFGPRENNGCPILNFDPKDIKFKVNSDKLTAPSLVELDKGVENLNQYPTLKLTVEGHASTTGTDKINNALSAKRATSVKTYLVSKGISENRLSTVSFGSTKPIADNKTAKGRAANQRVEFKIQE